MGKFDFRRMVSCVLLLLFPGSLLGADSNAAMLYISGAAWVNGTHVPRSSSAIFSGDLLQTPADSVANINEPGSSITVLSESLVQFGVSSVKIEHGEVSVSTSKQVATTAGEVKITPASSNWTEFDVADVDGVVRIAAKRGDLLIADGSSVVTLAQGQETTRDETSQDNSTNSNGKKKKKGNQQNGAAPAAGGGLLSSPWAIGIGAAAVAGVGGWVLSRSSNPASPVQP
jgi:hypothetical protein